MVHHFNMFMSTLIYHTYSLTNSKILLNDYHFLSESPIIMVDNSSVDSWWSRKNNRRLWIAAVQDKETRRTKSLKDSRDFFIPQSI